MSPRLAKHPLRVLRGVSPPVTLISEFPVADETLSLMRDMTAAGELEHLTPERYGRDGKCAYHPQSAGLLPCIARLRRPARPVSGNRRPVWRTRAGKVASEIDTEFIR